MSQRNIGRVLFINTDGGPQFTALYALPHALRDPELFTENGVYYQNHQRTDGQWVYKYMRPLGGRPSDQDLTEYRHPSDTNWDGPQPARPQATWEDVNHLLGCLIRQGGATTLELLQLQGLAYAVVHKLHVPDAPEPVEQAIPEAIDIELNAPAEIE